MAGPIRIAVLANASQAKRELDSVTTRGQKFQKALQTAGKLAAAGLLVVGAAAIKSGQAAAEDEAAQSRLVQTLRTAAKATDAQIAASDRFVTAAGKQYGVTDDELRPALSKLAIATGDVNKAQQLASLAMNVSAGSGKKLEAVSAALARAQATGNVAALAKFGVATKDAAGETRSLAAVTQDLANKYKGAAAKNAQTAAGKQKILAVQLGELQEQIGAKLLPVMNQAAQAGLVAVQWLSDNGDAAKAVAIAVGALTATVLAVAAAQKVYAAGAVVVTAATKTWAAATKVARGAQIALNIAMAISPVGVLVLAVAAIAAGLVLAYKKSDKFRAIVNAAFGAVVKGAKAAYEWIKSKWPLILAIITGPFGLAVLAIVKNWDKIKAGATAVKKWVSEKFEDILTKARSVADKIKTALLAPFEAVKNLILEIIEKIKSIKPPKIDLNPFNNGRVISASTSSSSAETFQTFVDQSVTYLDTAPRTYQINVSIPLGGSLVDAGRQIVQAITAYEEANGRTRA